MLSTVCDKFGVNYWFWTSKRHQSYIDSMDSYSQHLSWVNIELTESLKKLSVDTCRLLKLYFHRITSISLEMMKYGTIFHGMKCCICEWKMVYNDKRNTSRHVNTDIWWLHLAHLHIYFISWLIANQIELFLVDVICFKSHWIITIPNSFIISNDSFVI